MNKFDAITQDMFNPLNNGKVEKKQEKKLKAKKARDEKRVQREKEKHEEKMEALHKFEKEHPESFLFKEQKEFFSLLERMENIGK